MRNRRFTQVTTSDASAVPPRNSSSNDDGENPKRKKLRRSSEEEKDENTKQEEESKTEVDEDEEMEAVPVGEPVRVSGTGSSKKTHYASFHYAGLQYHLEDPVLLVPEISNEKPYVAIIKDITQPQQGILMVTGQWLYRPEDAEKRSGGTWQSTETRELFYSFHRDEVAAESVMHQCVLHFIPHNKQIPHRKQHPGFIVQKVYDTITKRLFKLTDKDYEEDKQHEIELLVQKTRALIGDLPDLEPQEATVNFEDQRKSDRLIRKKNRPTLLDVSKNFEGLNRSQSFKAEIPGTAAGSASEYYAILSKFDRLTGDTQRDKWLEKLLQSVQFVCAPMCNKQNNEKEQGVSDERNEKNPVTESQDKVPSDEVKFDWPNAALPAVVALENLAHETLCADFQKYNQKMRQLTFNLKSNAVLSRRLLKTELHPAEIMTMSPNELKEGLTAEEIANREPEETYRMQMTHARCKRCSEKQVALLDIIHTGHGDRYQLECVACGNNWYALRDDVSTLTIEGPSPGKTVGAAPLPTAKFDDVEKNLVSPRGAEKGPVEVLKKTSEAHVPVLDNQRSFNKTK